MEHGYDHLDSLSFHPLFLLSPSLLQITCDFGYSIFSIILVMTPAPSRGSLAQLRVH